MTRTEHLLVILGEECAEVARRASKALRFGLDEIQPGQPYTNAERVGLGMADLLGVYAMLRHEELLPDAAAMSANHDARRLKVEEFLKLSRARGTLEEQP